MCREHAHAHKTRPHRARWPLILILAALHATDAKLVQILGWQVELKENMAIRSPYYSECDFYTGKVVNEDRSAVTLTECEGQMYGLVQVRGEEFVLEPDSEEHVVRRRDVTLEDFTPTYNLTGDTMEFDLDYEEMEPHPHVRVRHSHLEEDYINDFHDNAITPVSIPLEGPNGYYLELALIADHSMMEFHGQARVRHYILALMNIVSAIFNDPSLESNMTLVINKLYLYEEKDSVIQEGDVRKSLNGVNKWNNRHLSRLPKGHSGWDAAIWLTRNPLGGPSGFAPVGGVCSRTRSASLNRDEGLTSAFVIAHELGHLLGLVHDGSNDCPKIHRQGTVMAPTVLATLHNFSWSPCSRQQFHKKARYWWCLQERSKDDGVELGGTKELTNFVFTMDEQCRNEFGDGFGVCKSMRLRSPCARLYCAHKSMPHVCRSKRQPPLEGTPCKKNHWCVDNVCEPMPGQGSDPEEYQPPKWQDWGVWSNCSADCGYGLKTRSRECIFKGESMESQCEGASSQAASCWSGQECVGAVRDIRADLCRRRDELLIPSVQNEDSKVCEVWCVNYKGGESRSLGSAPDGTPCSYERPYDLCFQGACVKGYCDSSDSFCNWCPDGYCNNNTHIYTRTLRRGWTRIAVIPHDANLLSIHISTPTPLGLVLKEKRKDRPIIYLKKHSTEYTIPENNYLRYDPDVPQNLQIVELDNNVIDLDSKGLKGEIVSAGTIVQWDLTDAEAKIKAKSKLISDLMILASPAQYTGELLTVHVSVNYSTPTNNRRPQNRWRNNRGPCSVSCGGGRRAVYPRCHSSRNCPPVKYEACNTHSCEFKWLPGEWEACSASCGDLGYQERQLFCVPVNFKDTGYRRSLVRSSVSPALCKSPRPERRQPCNRVQCPVYWQEGTWTPCSASCGRGVSYQTWSCPASDDLFCGPKPAENQRQCRLRRCPPKQNPTCSDENKTQYCDLFPTEELIRNCQIPPFRKYCCRTCRDVLDEGT